MNPLLLAALALLGYLLLLFTNPAAVHLRDGSRVLMRQPKWWKLPAGFGLAYGLFLIALDVLFLGMAPDQAFAGWGAWGDVPAMPEMLTGSALPAVQRLAGLFGNLIPVFPLSVIAGWLLLVNWGGSAGELWRVLSKRWHFGGVIAFFGVLACALAAGLKFCIYPALLFSDRFGDPDRLFAWCAVIDWMSSLFEWGVGVGLQIMLILQARAWVRGSKIDFEDLWKLAVRRLGFVLKWGGIILFLNTLLLHLPVVLPHFVNNAPGLDGMLSFADIAGRWMVSLFLILFCTMQMILTLHNDSLREAFRAHCQFVRSNGYVLFWFLLIAALHFYVLACAEQWLEAFLGVNTGPGFFKQVALPVLWALLSGWLLASWVCLYKQRTSGERSVAY